MYEGGYMENLGSVAAFVGRAAQQCGFERERFIEARIPTNFSDIVTVLFLGDLRGTFIMSSVVLHQLIKKLFHDKYVILCSWPGCGGYFPYVDEYWSITDQASLSDICDRAVGMYNTDPRYLVYARNLRKYFENVLTTDDIDPYYKDGLTSKWLKECPEMDLYWPLIPSPRPEVGQKLATVDKKIIISPVRYGKAYYRREVNLHFNRDFWVELAERLLAEGIVPVVWQNYGTYDLSTVFGEKCIYITDRNQLNVLAAIRSCGCLLDVFSGLNRVATAARTPYISCDDRVRYMNTKDYEMTDLCVRSLPHRYIFSFPTIIENGRFREIIDHVMNVVGTFLVGIDYNALPSTSESYEKVSYNVVRERKAKRIGARFIRVERLVMS